MMSKNKDNLNPYFVKSSPLSGTDFKELEKKAKIIFREIEKKTKRRPYIRSAYFNKQKVFFDYFWQHLNQKRKKERKLRLKLFNVAIEVIKNSRNAPVSVDNPSKRIKKSSAVECENSGPRISIISIANQDTLSSV